MKTKKSLGQYFLRDKKILKKIVNFARIKKSDTVIEIGPGEGTLTAQLLASSFQVLAIEKDKELAENLQKKFKKEIKNNKLKIINEDVLNYKLKATSYKLIGNIPYYITGAIFKKFLQSENPPKSITFVVQKEVADRIKNKKGSILSISIKAYGEPEYGGIIKAGSFYPKPKVDSAIISVRDIGKKRFTEERIKEKTFFEILKKGFSHKRKLLTNNLKISPKILKKCGIAEKARAENLTLENWLCLTRKFLEAKS